MDAPDNPDNDGSDSVYLRDFSLAGVTYSILVSRLNGAAGANADSRAHVEAISADGKRVTFSSDADNLRPGPGNYGIYIRDVSANQTVFVGDNYEYTVTVGLAPNGRYVAWTSYGKATADADSYIASVYGRSLGAAVTSLGAIEQISRPAGNAPYVAPSLPIDNESLPGALKLSADGRYAVMVGPGDRLAGVSGDFPVVLRKDMRTGEIVVVSRADGPGGEAVMGREASISADGNRVAFTTRAKLDPADTNDVSDVYVRDIAAKTTTLVSRANGAGGAVGNDHSGAGKISGDGRRVLFKSEAGNLGGPGGSDHLYVRDLAGAQTALVDRASGEAGAIASSYPQYAAISDDGRRVVFITGANNLHADDPDLAPDVFVRDLTTHETTLESRRPGTGGAKLTGFPSDPAISGDGHFITFSTDDSQAVPGTGPWDADQVVRRELANGQNTLISRVAGGGAAGNAHSRGSTISADGSKVAFVTRAANLRPEISGGEERSIAVVSDLSVGGKLSGPPAFGRPVSHQGVRAAEISRDGRCLTAEATGHNALTGPLGDTLTLYMYVLAGDCHIPDPPPALRPRLSAVSLKPKKFAVAKKSTAKVAAASKAKKGRKGKKRAPKGTTIRFRLNTTADVRIGFQRRTMGIKAKVGKGKKGAKGKAVCRKAPARVLRQTKAKKRCGLWRPVGAILRKNRVGDKPHKIRFSGRIGKKALKPGRYRAVLTASNSSGKSTPVRRPFRIMRR